MENTSSVNRDRSRVDFMVTYCRQFNLQMQSITQGYCNGMNFLTAASCTTIHRIRHTLWSQGDSRPRVCVFVVNIAVPTRRHGLRVVVRITESIPLILLQVSFAFSVICYAFIVIL